MKKLVTLIAFIVLFNNMIKAQDCLTKRTSTIKAFLSAVFEEKKETHFIIEHYLHLAPNNSVSTLQKETIINSMIDTLVKRNNKIFPSSNYKIFTYDNFKGEKKRFNTDDFKDIMIVAIKNKAIIYFQFNQDRIMSFYTIEKGSLSFFVTI